MVIYMRMFIALELETNNLLPLKEQLKNVKGRFVNDQNFHMTLAFLGDTPLNRINDLKNILNSISLNLKEINSTNVSTFHKNVVVINFERNVELINYQKKLTKLLKENNFNFDNKPYVPHLTLIRHSSENIKFEFKKAFKIKKIHLFSSTLDVNGSIYDSLFTKDI